MLLPLLVIGFVISLILASMFGGMPGVGPDPFGAGSSPHPIVDWLTEFMGEKAEKRSSPRRLPKIGKKSWVFLTICETLNCRDSLISI